jgi:methylated-DNA-protein-cysteine methyltransferase-like protein
MSRSAPANPDPADRILAAVRTIPRGRVAGYGQVAALAGLPGRARLVVRVLAQAGASARLPWHRVLRSDGRIAFPAGSAPFERQVERLRAEGVAVHAGRIAPKHFIGERDLDAALWGPRAG